MCWVEGVDPVAGAFWTLDELRGGPPRVGATVTGFEDMFAAVRSGAAIAAVPASIASTLPFADVAARDVDGLPGATVAICRRAGTDDPLVEAFAACALEVCAADSIAARYESRADRYFTSRRAAVASPPCTPRPSPRRSPAPPSPGS